MRLPGLCYASIYVPNKKNLYLPTYNYLLISMGYCFQELLQTAKSSDSEVFCFKKKSTILAYNLCIAHLWAIYNVEYNVNAMQIVVKLYCLVYNGQICSRDTASCLDPRMQTRRALSISFLPSVFTIAVFSSDLSGMYLCVRRKVRIHL